VIRLDATAIDETIDDEDERKRTMEIIRCDASPAIGRRRRGVGADSVDDGSPQGSRLCAPYPIADGVSPKGGSVDPNDES
jgi:hypothetical protein